MGRGSWTIWVILPVIRRVLTEGGRSAFDAEEGRVMTKARCYIPSFEGGGKGQEPKNVSQAALEPGKGQATDIPLEPPEGTRPVDNGH